MPVPGKDPFLPVQSFRFLHNHLPAEDKQRLSLGREGADAGTIYIGVG